MLVTGHQQTHAVHASRSQQGLSSSAKSMFRYEKNDRNASNTSRRFATPEHRQLLQVECTLAGVTKQLHDQSHKLKKLQAEIARVIFTLDTLIVSQSVSQQLLDQARVNKMHRSCSKHGQVHSIHVRHACGTTAAVQAAIDAGELIEALMHDVGKEIVRVRDMGWQQCMDFEWGVRPLIAQQNVPGPQRMSGVRVAHWKSNATRFMKNLFRGKHGRSRNDDPAAMDCESLSSGQNVPLKVPEVDVASEKCLARERSRVFRLGGMSRQQG